MQGRAFKQVVRGHVIRPAQVMTTKTTGKQFLSFSLAVDNLLDGKETGFVNCSYWPHRDRALTEDIVACSLLWITNDEQDGLVFADGSKYKRVEVTVEGQLGLRTVEGSKGYYVNLSYCTVDIHDAKVVKGVRQALGLDNNAAHAAPQQNVGTTAPAPVGQNIEVPTTAPTAVPQTAPTNVPPQAAPQASAAPTNVPQEGQLVTAADGTVYKIENGQYIAIGKVNQAAPTTPPAAAAAPTTAQPATPNTIGAMLGGAPTTNFGS